MILIGAGGLATQVMDVVTRMNPSARIAFFDNITPRQIGDTKFGFDIYQNYTELIENFPTHQGEVIMALASIQAKQEINLFLKANAISCKQITAHTALMGTRNVHLGNGTIIMEQCIIESNVQIGDLCLINTASKIFHDTKIGDLCEIAPNCSVLGKCTIGNRVFIGANATILPGTTIEDDVIIGAGSIVTKNVTSGTRVKGNPAKAY